MKIFLLILCIMTVGDKLMAGQQDFINKDKYSEFKESINFEKLMATLPEEKRVIVNWKSALSSFKDDENKQWVAPKITTAIGLYNARLKANIGYNDESVTVKISSFNEGRKLAIDMALKIATNTSAPFVIYKLSESSIGDFCLVPVTRDYAKFMMFVYGNILVELEHFGEDKDVLSVARYIQSIMEQAVAANPEQKLPARPTFNYKLNPLQPRIDEPFLVQVSPPQAPDGWEFNVAKKELTDGVKYKRNMGSKGYQFIADSSGSKNIVFNLMDKRTLWIYTDTVPVNIE